MILDDIVAYKKKELEQKKRECGLDQLKSFLTDPAPPRSFKWAISRPKGVNIIAEIKKASPSAGVIRKEFDPIEIAGIYAASGAAAISVLTDQHFFQGSLEFLCKIKSEINLPLLRKDFIIDEYQIYESRLKGADALLLIVSLLDQEKLKGFLRLAHSLGLSCLVEVHDIDDLKRALLTDADMIGINNRDLHTFQVDINTTFKLIRHIPPGRIIVSESGIRSREDIYRLKEKGVNAFLVGESLMKEDDIAQKLKELL